MTLTDKIKQAIEPIVIKNGQELIEIFFDENSRDKKLRVIVGSLKGPTINELTAITKTFNKLNDDISIIPFDFSLDVSSPGLDRPLKTKADFARNIKREISVKYRDENDLIQKKTGIIEEISDSEIIIDIKGVERKKIALINIIKAKLIIKIGKRK